MLTVVGGGEGSLAVRVPEGMDALDTAWFEGIKTLPTWDGDGNVGAEDLYLFAKNASPPRPLLLDPYAQDAMRVFQAQQTAALLSRKSIGPDLTDLTNTSLWPDEEEVVRFLYWRKKAGNFSAVGMGKTLCALAWFSLLRKEGKAGTALVMCRNDVKRTWDEQCKKHFRGRYAIMPNGTENVLEALSMAQHKDAELICIHYDAILNREVFEALMSLESEVLIADESHVVKRIQAQRTKNFLTLNTRKQFPYVLFMTASPVSESPNGAWVFLRCIEPSRVRSYTRFADFFTTYKKMPIISKGQKITPFTRWRKVPTGYQNLPHLRELITDVSIRKTHEDVTGMPKVVYKAEPVSMPSNYRAVYEDLSQGLAELVTETIDGPTKIRLDLIGQRLLRLRQFLSWPKSLGIDMESPKIPVLDALLEEILDDPQAKVIVWACFKDCVDGLVGRYTAPYKALPYTGDLSMPERSKVLDAFLGKDEHRILICTPDAAHLGLNLQRARVSIHVDRPLKLDFAEQSDGRIIRRDGIGTATIIDLQAADTVDEWVLKVLRRKLEMKNTILGVSATSNIEVLESGDDLKELLPYVAMARRAV